MDIEEIRPFVLACIRDYPVSRSLQIISLINTVISNLKQRGYYGDRWIHDERDRTRGPEFNEDREKIRTIIWEFIIQGILIPGADDTQPDLPFLTVTEYGKKVIEIKEIQPHDPDGYLAYVKGEIPNIDNEIERYLTESLQAYLRGLMLSSVVSLGVASEKAFILLLGALTDSITDSRKNSKFRKLQTNISTKKKFDEVKKEIINIRPKLPRDVQENLETHLEGVFNVIRVTRNEAGHPTGRIIRRDEAFVNLRLFVHYLKKIYQLIDWLNQNSI